MVDSVEEMECSGNVASSWDEGVWLNAGGGQMGGGEVNGGMRCGGSSEL